MSEPRKIQLSQQVQAAMVAASNDVERTKQEAAMMVELAQTRHQLLMTQIERDYEFRFAEARVEKDGTVIVGTKRPRPIPPEAMKNITKSHKPAEPPAETPADPPAGAPAVIIDGRPETGGGFPGEPSSTNHQPPDA